MYLFILFLVIWVASVVSTFLTTENRQDRIGYPIISFLILGIIGLLISIPVSGAMTEVDERKVEIIETLPLDDSNYFQIDENGLIYKDTKGNYNEITGVSIVTGYENKIKKITTTYKVESNWTWDPEPVIDKTVKYEVTIKTRVENDEN